MTGACEASLACSTCHVYVKDEFRELLPEPEEGLVDKTSLASISIDSFVIEVKLTVFLQYQSAFFIPFTVFNIL